jgi:hypothetical protein
MKGDFTKDGIFAKDGNIAQKGKSTNRGDVHLPCQLREGDTKRVTTAAPGRAANPDHDTDKRAGYAASKGVSLKASPKSAEGVTIETDFTVEGELSKNFAGEADSSPWTKNLPRKAISLQKGKFAA